MNWKKTTMNLTFGLLLTAVLAGAFLKGRSDRRQIRCTKISVTVEDSAAVKFVGGKVVFGYLISEYKGILGMPIDSIDLKKVEDILDGKSAILSNDAYITKDGVLHVSVTQRKPLVRFQTNRYGFYCDEDGYLFPLEESFISNIQIVDGQIPIDTADCRMGRPEDPEDSKWLDNVVDMVKFINSSPIWKDRIVQISCGSDGELTLVPESGKEKFLFGPPEDIREKFEKMELYYTNIAAGKEEGYYNSVDLRFADQIICRNRK